MDGLIKYIISYIIVLRFTFNSAYCELINIDGICGPCNLSNLQLYHRTLNGTFDNVLFGNDSVIETSKPNVLSLLDRFPKVITPLHEASSVCMRDSALYLHGLKDFEMWALKMFDATAKLPSGILSGNINQYGHFDQCLSTFDKIQGKYCLASLEIDLDKTMGLKDIDSLVHAHYYMRSNLTDSGHRLPRFSSILWGVCMPSSCTGSDLEKELIFHLKGLNAKISVPDAVCSVKSKQRKITFGSFIAVLFLTTITLLVLFGTFCDNGKSNQSSLDKILHAFSLKCNLRKLLDVSNTNDDIKGVDGIRAINALALLLAHKSMAMVFNPFVNRVQMSKTFGMPWAVIGRTAILFTDSFLFLSGFLNAHNLFNDLRKSGYIDIRNRLISRWFRLFPLLFTLILFCTYILPELNNGPQWNLTVETHSEICKSNMWKSFLLIHNLFGFETMCLTHTHQVAMDMQLYLMTPAIVVLIWKWPMIGLLVSLTISVLSTLLRYMAIYKYNISMIVYYGVSINSLLDAAKYSYILPTHRATIYLIGVVAAYFLMSDKTRFKISNVTNRVLWIITFTCGVITWLGPYKTSSMTYQYDQYENALYSAFAPILWGVFLVYLQWAMLNGYAGWLPVVLSSRPFKLFNKIAYGLYLTQFPLYFYNVGVQRHSDYYNPLHLFYIPEVLMIIFVSVVATVTIEMPFNQIYKDFFCRANAKVKEQ